jgi:succinate dehydrogenase flavin-adding protein (antitoxin of CptAB toxin-antitoxin module)
MTMTQEMYVDTLKDNISRRYLPHIISATRTRLSSFISEAISKLSKSEIEELVLITGEIDPEEFDIEMTKQEAEAIRTINAVLNNISSNVHAKAKYCMGCGTQITDNNIVQFGSAKLSICKSCTDRYNDEVINDFKRNN